MNTVGLLGVVRRRGRAAAARPAPRAAAGRVRRAVTWLARSLKNRSFQAVAAMSLSAALLCYAPEISARLHFSAGEAVPSVYYAAGYRLLYPVAAAIAGWRLGVKGGLVVCITVGSVILSHVAAGFAVGTTSIDLAVICVGFVFGCLAGRQGEMNRMLEGQARALRERSEALAKEVAERKQIEAQLIMTDRLASIGELVSGVAHEVNNPLTGVIGISQLMMQKDLPDDVREDIATVLSEAERAARVVRDLLTFARKHPPANLPSHVNDIIEDTLRLRAYEQKRHGVEVVRNLDPALPKVMVDYHQMQQVFFNIIINAEYFMVQHHNRGTLTITTERADGHIRALFADDGPGIPEPNLTRIFEPFFTTKEVGKGTGLGLSICHGIVSAQGGRIYVQSRPGKGATFVVELPLSSS